MQQEQAETIAIQALGWLATMDDMMANFLGSTGADIDSVRQNAQDPAFLGAVLDFLLLDDQFVTGFCDSIGLPYDTPFQARQFLPGGEMVNWT